MTFLYKIDIEGFKKFQQKMKLTPVGFKLTMAAITGLEFNCLTQSANLSVHVSQGVGGAVRRV